MEKPGRRPACLRFSETPPARTRKQHADEDVLRQNPPDEGDDHRQELIQGPQPDQRSEEHTSELQSLMRISYAVFCLKKKTKYHTIQTNTHVDQYYLNSTSTHYKT